MKNKKKVILLVGIICCFFLLLILCLKKKDKKSDYLLVDIERNNNVNNPIDYEEDIKRLKQEYNNEDIVGILEIENSNYVVPILQADDNEYYLNHDAYGKDNYMGAIYLDFRVDIDSSRKLLIFGHNSSNVDMPFKILEKYYDEEYYNNHKYITITTSLTKKRYEIFSIFIETDDFSYMNINFSDREDYLNHLNKLKDKSLFNTELSLSEDDEILILQTCSTHSDYRDYEKKYLLVISKRI